MPCFLLKSDDVSEEHVASYYLLDAGSLLMVFFDPEDGGDISVENIGLLCHMWKVGTVHNYRYENCIDLRGALITEQLDYFDAIDPIQQVEGIKCSIVKRKKHNGWLPGS
jgi:hypothetical protein